jgi:cytochrome c553
VTSLAAGWWRPLVLGLAVAFCAHAAEAQPLAERVKLCAACHGEDGNSHMPNVPSLAGQPEFFVLNQLVLMREGVRQVEAMKVLVKDLKDDDLIALSKHYAALTPKASDEPIDAALVKRGTEVAAQKRCVSCHGLTLAGQDQIPRLAKQRIDFLIQVLKEFRDKPRGGADTIMSGAVAGLPDGDLAALAHYAASK